MICHDAAHLVVLGRQTMLVIWASWPAGDLTLSHSCFLAILITSRLDENDSILSHHSTGASVPVVAAC